MSYLSFLYAIDAVMRLMFLLLMLAVLYAAAHLAGYAPACIAWNVVTSSVICLPF